MLVAADFHPPKFESRLNAGYQFSAKGRKSNSNVQAD